jgi:hypothetical protein
LGEFRDLGKRLFGIGSNAEIHIERVSLIAELEQDVPECQAVLPAGHCHKKPIILSEHLLRLDRSRNLIVDEAIEAALTECRIVAGETDDSFGFTSGAIHL